MAGRAENDLMDYAAWKLLHQGAVVASIGGFALRGAASFAGARWTRGRLARTLPHAVDTLLLLSALVMAWTLRLTPSGAPWLTAKIGGLLLYIGLGMLALRPGPALRVRVGAWLAALAVAGWIVSVALTKSPLGALRLLGG
jgi:uncharacterized membrane protein SirB2